jgi:murein DD-endopeptidase MepM/ murein hydrolase activator NlpD
MALRVNALMAALAMLLPALAATPALADEVCGDTVVESIPVSPAAGAAPAGGSAAVIIHPGEWSRAAPERATVVVVRPPVAQAPVAATPRVTAAYADRTHATGQRKVVYAPGARPPAPPAPVPVAAAVLPGGLALPIAGAPVTSGFGWRIHPVLGVRKFHNGIDLGAPRGTPVRAALEGSVEACGRRPAEGLFVALRHAGRVETLYAHLDRFPAGLRRGQPVPAGGVIGYVGSTGLSTGPHLFYEVMVDGRPVNPVGAGADALGSLASRTALATGTR